MAKPPGEVEDEEEGEDDGSGVGSNSIFKTRLFRIRIEEVFSLWYRGRY